MKKSIIFCICVLVMFSGIVSADTVIKVILNGTKISFPDQQPIIENSRTLVPVRFVSEALGANVDWIQAEKKVVITKDSKKIEMVVGQRKVKIDRKVIELDVASKFQNDRTLVPLRFISEAFGCQVDWDQKSYTVNINTVNETEIKPVKMDDSYMQQIYDNVPGLVVPEERLGDIIFYSEDGQAGFGHNDLYVDYDENTIYLCLNNSKASTLNIAKLILKQYYPKQYEKAYDYLKKTFETDLRVRDTYLDNRLIESQKFPEATCIYIGKEVRK